MAIPVYENQEQSFADFFEADRQLPSFTVALRGYHKEEVDDYLRQVREAEAEEASTRVRLEAEIDRLHRRVATLERCLSEETPHTIDALGERVVLILRHAEEGANQALAEAHAQAEALRREAAERAENFVRQASLRCTQATQQLASARAEADDMRQQQEANAARQAAEIVARAEQQALALVSEGRRRAEEIGQRVREEEARSREAMFQLRARFDAEIDRLAERRRRLLESLEAIHAALGDTLSGATERPAAERQAAERQAGERPTGEQPAVPAARGEEAAGARAEDAAAGASTALPDAVPAGED